MKIAILTMVHNLRTEYTISLWRNTLKNLTYNTVPIYLFGDCDCPEWAQKEVMENYPSIKIDFEAPNTEWEKFRYGFDKIDADWIAVCHQDDLWLQNKLREQMKWVKKDIPMVTTGYIDLSHNQNHIWKYPFLHSQYGIIDAMPSTWLINKQLIQKWPSDPFPSRVCKDLGFFLTINQYGKIIVVQNPYVLYNNHAENGWNTLTPTEREEGRSQLEALSQRLKPNIEYVWGTLH